MRSNLHTVPCVACGRSGKGLTQWWWDHGGRKWERRGQRKCGREAGRSSRVCARLQEGLRSSGCAVAVACCALNGRALSHGAEQACALDERVHWASVRRAPTARRAPHCTHTAPRTPHYVHARACQGLVAQKAGLEEAQCHVLGAPRVTLGVAVPLASSAMDDWERHLHRAVGR
jgi:hypothetical protein